VNTLTVAAELGARLRGARLLHPRGRSFTGEWETLGASGHPWGCPFLDHPRRFPATVRVSKSLPTPTGWPDVLGLAVRLTDPGRGAGPFDVLLSSAARRPVLRHVPWPQRDFGGTYGTMLAYRAGAARVFLAATVPYRTIGPTLEDVVRAAATRSVVFTIAAATRWSRWRPVATVRLGAVLDASSDARLAFNPIAHHPPGLVPVGWLQHLRGLAYPGSQAGRRRSVR
jgi:hypothetical protein